MNRRDHLVELACLWQELRADRPPVRRPHSTGNQPVSLYEGSMHRARIGARIGEEPKARTAPR
jgi:hypothetical protein